MQTKYCKHKTGFAHFRNNFAQLEATQILESTATEMTTYTQQKNTTHAMYAAQVNMQSTCHYQLYHHYLVMQ